MSVNSKTIKTSAIFIAFAIFVIIIAKLVFTLPGQEPITDDATLMDRIKPIGQVYVEGDTETVAIVADSATVSTNSRSGEEVVASSCTGCHGVGVLGAPKVGDKSDWAPRAERGISELLKTAISGKGAMPPKGTCTTCSDSELQAAIEFMIN